MNNLAQKKFLKKYRRRIKKLINKNNKFNQIMIQVKIWKMNMNNNNIKNKQ